MELLLSLAGWFLTAWFAAGVIAVLSTIGLAFRHLRPTKNTAVSKPLRTVRLKASQPFS